MARLRLWCADTTAASAKEDGVMYRFVYVDQKGFEQHPPATLAAPAAETVGVDTPGSGTA
jgi:type III restriction enzyme